MDQQEAFKKLSKDQTIHLIIWQMFQKEISLDELTEQIRLKEKEIVEKVNDHFQNELKAF